MAVPRTQLVADLQTASAKVSNALATVKTIPPSTDDFTAEDAVVVAIGTTADEITAAAVALGGVAPSPAPTPTPTPAPAAPLSDAERAVSGT